MSGQIAPTVLGEFALSNAFLGLIVKVCLATQDHERTMAGLVRLGIGPLRVHTFDHAWLAAPAYHGQDAAFSIRSASPTTPG